MLLVINSIYHNGGLLNYPSYCNLMLGGLAEPDKIKDFLKLPRYYKGKT